MSAASASSERIRRAVASSRSSTVVLILTRAMPYLYHICGTNVAARVSGLRETSSAGAPMSQCFAQCLVPPIGDIAQTSGVTSGMRSCARSSRFYARPERSREEMMDQEVGDPVPRVVDHVGFAVADYGRSKAFYEKALAPLGLTLLMEFAGAAAGFGK